MVTMLSKTLPTGLADVYQAYKRHTETIVKWLLSRAESGGGSISNPENVSVNNLLQYTSQIVAKGIDIPLELYWKLEDTISARLEIANFYGQLHRHESTVDEAQDSHIHFIQALCQIQHQLFPHGPKRSVQVIRSKRMAYRTETAESDDSNRYALLEVEDAVDGQIQDGVPTQYEERPTQARMRQAGLEDQSQGGMVLEDDAGALIIRFAFFMLEADFVCSKINLYWERVAHDNMSMARAAFLTNIAFNALKDSIAHPHIHCHYLQTVVEEYLQSDIRPGILAFISSRIDCPKSNVFRESEASFIYELLKGLPSIDGPTADPERHEKLVDLVRPSPSPDTENTSVLRDGITMVKSLLETLRHMAQAFGRKCNDADFVKRYCLPDGVDVMFTPFMNRLTNSCKCADPFLVVGLQLHVEIYRTVINTDINRLKRSHFRLQALRFAREVHTAVVGFLDYGMLWHDCSRCEWNCNTKWLQEYAESLQRYTSTKRFDYYHQAPWAAGAQMVGMNQLATVHGLQACNDRCYLGIVLHAYNALRTKGYMEEICLFEELCKILTGTVFMGSRTSQNFRSALTCYLGARLKFGKTKKDKEHLSYRLEISKSDKQMFTGEKRIQPKSISIFSVLARPDGFSPSGEILTRCLKATRPDWSALGSDAVQRRSEAESTALFKSIRILDCVDEATKSEFEGAFPITKINWFAVRIMAQEIFEVIDDGYRKQPNADTRHRPGGLGGLDLVVTVLSSIDDVDQGRLPREEVQDSTAFAVTKFVLESKKSPELMANFTWKEF